MATSIYKYGSKGDGVKSIQTQLNDWGASQSGYVPLSVDGSFGSKTQNALRNFQTATGIESDGIYGDQTAGAFSNLNVQPNAVATQTTPIVPTQEQPAIPTVPVQQSPYDMKFDYNSGEDKGMSSAIELAKSKIAQEMAARGIGGSSIEQERIAQAVAGLNLDYRNQAYQQFQGDRASAIQKYENDYNTARQAKEDAWETAQERGYFNNEEAKLWGMQPGEKTASERARQAEIEQQKADRQAEVQIAQAKASATASEQQYASQNEVPKSTMEAYNAQYAINPQQAVANLYSNMINGRITDQQVAVILNSLKQEVSYTVDKRGNKISNTTVYDPWALFEALENKDKPSRNPGGRYTID